MLPPTTCGCEISFDMSSLEVISCLLPPTTSCAVSFGTAGLGSAMSRLSLPTGCGCTTGEAGSLPLTTSGAGSFHMAGMAGMSCLPLPTGCGCTTGASDSLLSPSLLGSFRMAGTSCLPVSSLDKLVINQVNTCLFYQSCKVHDIVCFGD